MVNGGYEAFCQAMSGRAPQKLDVPTRDSGSKPRFSPHILSCLWDICLVLGNSWDPQPSSRWELCLKKTPLGSISRDAEHVSELLKISKAAKLTDDYLMRP